MVKLGRNALCPCGSGKKYKKCHGSRNNYLELSLYLANKNKFELLKAISEDIRKKANKYLFSEKTTWVQNLVDIDLEENTIFSCERFNELIKLVLINASDKLDVQDKNLLAKCKALYIKDFAKEPISSNYIYPEMYSIFVRQFSNGFKGLIFDEFSRTYQYMILLKEEKSLNLTNSFIEKYDMSVEEVFETLYIICIIVSFTKEYSNIFSEGGENLLSESVWKHIQSLLNFLSCQDNDLLNNNLLLNKFFLKTQNKYLCLNAFALINYMSNGVYWIARDIYRDKNDCQLIKTFGEKTFPKYIETIFSYNSISYQNLDSNNALFDVNHDLHADYLIESSKYILIIEAKSTHPPISLRNDIINDKEYENF